MANKKLDVVTVKKMRILGIAGSLRAASYNKMLLVNARQIAPLGMEIVEFDLAEIPMYNADLDMEDKPAPVSDFLKAIAAADGLLVSTPEYNYGIPGVLKNALDWASRPAGKSPLYNKAVALAGVTTGMWGTVRAQLQLRQVFFSTRSRVVMEPEVMIAQAKYKFDENGTLTDADALRYVCMLLEGLANLAILRG
jgi:chromate reductase, NAD(P)H dehydrogenase (quinone)